ncbi:hypothetical protein D9M70_435350 [compost metagenome]
MIDHGQGIPTHFCGTGLVPVGHGRVADELLHRAAITRSGHHLSRHERVEGAVVAKRPAQLNGRERGAQVFGGAQRIRLDQHGVQRPGARQAQATSADWPGQTGEHRPAICRRLDDDLRRRRHRKFQLALQQVRGVQARIAFPVQRGLTAATTDRLRLPVLPGATKGDMVLVILPHAGQGVDPLDAVGAQLVFRPDPGLHEHLGRVHRAQGQDDFACRVEALPLAVDQHLDARCPGALEQHAGHQRTGKNRQVRVVQPWPDIGVVHGFALALVDAQIGDRGAARTLHHLAIGTVERGDAQSAGRLQGCPGERLGRGGLRDVHGAARTTPPRIGAALPVLDPLVVAQHRLIAPGGVAGLGGEMIPIRAVPACPDHHVDGRSTAEALAHAQGQATAVQVGSGLPFERPVACRPQVQGPLRRIGDLGASTGGARFNQQDPGVGLVGKAGGDHATRRACATDDEIVISITQMIHASRPSAASEFQAFRRG